MTVRNAVLTGLAKPEPRALALFKLRFDLTKVPQQSKRQQVLMYETTGACLGIARRS
jgi:hypothetical protein